MATIRQKEAFKKVMENGGNVSKSMREAKYSPESAHTPQKLTDSKGWKELMAKYLPDDELVKKHKELLNATRLEHMVFPGKTLEKDIKSLLAGVNCVAKKIQKINEIKHVWFWAKDNIALKSALDMGYKLTGKYAPEKHDINFDKFKDHSDEEINQELKRREQGGTSTSSLPKKKE